MTKKELIQQLADYPDDAIIETALESRRYPGEYTHRLVVGTMKRQVGELTLCGLVLYQSRKKEKEAFTPTRPEHALARVPWDAADPVKEMQRITEEIRQDIDSQQEALKQRLSR